METQGTIKERLTQWLALHSLGRKPTTVHFNTEIIGIIRKHLPGLDRDATALTTDELLAFAHSSRTAARRAGMRWCPRSAS